MYKKQTSVSHMSTESELVSLDAGLRMDGSLALDLWDVVIEVLRETQGNATSVASNSRETVAGQKTIQKTHPNPNKRNLETLIFLCESSFYELAFLSR